MIERIYTEKGFPVVSSSTTLFKLVAVLAILNKFGAMKMGKLQVYLWAVSNNDNTDQVLKWKNEGAISNSPFVVEVDLLPLLSQCQINHYIDFGRNDRHVITSYEINILGSSFMADIAYYDITMEINNRLKEIGNLTDTIIKNIKFDF